MKGMRSKEGDEVGGEMRLEVMKGLVVVVRGGGQGL